MWKCYCKAYRSLWLLLGCWACCRIAYEARKQFPHQKIWITNEIIHNPTVNKRLEEMEVKDIPIEEGEKQFDVVDKGDVVILLCFGAAVDEMLTLSNLQVNQEFNIYEGTTDYFQNSHGIIFLVDRNDSDRVVDARDELHRMLDAVCSVESISCTTKPVIRLDLKSEYNKNLFMRLA
ncbi:unnamed protein product [Lactuca virosa]|uniref:4-hydroxy-3-methylbut-2-enyl diphosphate reductase n=1 Tax=Lactuca virosa TaxID=75947 RepID=A0AAU9MFV0_9ASTR|nr:unnamed protein product [Lactuca virosa]